MANPFDNETVPEEELDPEEVTEVEEGLEEEDDDLLPQDTGMGVDYDPWGEELDEEEWHYDPGPSVVENTRPADPSDYAAVVHDSFGEKYVNVTMLAERAASVTILRILGVLSLVPKGDVQYFLDGALVSADHVISAGQIVYVVGKLAGGR